MKQILLTQGKSALVDDEDFEALSKFKWCYSDPNKSGRGYAARREPINRKLVSMQQQLMGRGWIDHIDGDTLNNTRANLRACTQRENNRNKRRPNTNKSGYKGVRRSNSKSKPWAASIQVDYRGIHLGHFHTAEEAHEAYKKAAIELHGEFAKW